MTLGIQVHLVIIWHENVQCLLIMRCMPVLHCYTMVYKLIEVYINDTCH
jgi:hypothetical protein